MFCKVSWVLLGFVKVEMCVVATCFMFDAHSSMLSCLRETASLVSRSVIEGYSQGDFMWFCLCRFKF